MQMLATWRTDGFDFSQLEVWAVGHAGNGPLVAWFANGGEGACFEDSSDPSLSAYASYGAAQDDLFVIDDQGVIQHHVSTLTMSLSIQANQQILDGWVRALLP